MKHYIRDLLLKFNHPIPKKPCHSPHSNKVLTHGAKIQYAELPDESPTLNEPDTKTIQAIIGSLLYYA